MEKLKIQIGLLVFVVFGEAVIIGVLLYRLNGM